MKVGTIFIWRDFPFLYFEDEPKDIYAIYLGNSSPLIDESEKKPYIIFQKLTGKNHLYDPGGERAGKLHYRFRKDEYPKFEKDTIFDFEFPEESREKTIFDAAKIEILYELNEDKIRMIYNKIIKVECGIIHIHKCRIRECLNNEGITGLKEPSRKKR